MNTHSNFITYTQQHSMESIVNGWWMLTKLMNNFNFISSVGKFMQCATVPSCFTRSTVQKLWARYRLPDAYLNFPFEQPSNNILLAECVKPYAPNTESHSVALFHFNLFNICVLATFQKIVDAFLCYRFKYLLREWKNMCTSNFLPLC